LAPVAGARSRAPERAALPLQWPLVGRHEELDLFATTLADPRAHGFVIHGPAGVGKTRLADQCLAMALADQNGRTVARATATEGSRSTPLGALAHLLPAGISDERRGLVAVMSEVRTLLREQATYGPLVLFVDDLHLLDDTSATLLGQLVDADLVFLVATVRTPESVSPALESLWYRARVQRIDLDDLSRAAVDTLLHLVLHGPVEGSASMEIWTASQGNVLFVRELVLGALTSGRLVQQRGVWRLAGALVATPRLHELVAARLGTLGPSTTAALDVLAVWDRTGLVALETMVGSEPLEVLDRAGLLELRTDGRRQQVTLAHPLYGEIVRARMPALTRRRHLRAHIDCIESYGARRREDAIRLATARLEAYGWADPKLLIRAARLARYGHDFAQVEQFTRAAMLDGATPEGGLLLGEALHELGQYVEADDVLTSTDVVSTTEAELVAQITEIRTRNLMWGLLHPDEAIEVNRAVRSQLQDATAVEELTLNEALLFMYSGRPLDALAVLEPIGDLTRRRARTLRALIEVPALIAIGRCETAEAEAARAFAEQSELPDQIAIPGPGVHIIMRVFALSESGRLGHATALATAAYDATPATAPPDGPMWLAHQLGRCALLSGRVETARRWFVESLTRSEGTNTISAHRLALSSLATADACLGDGAAAANAVLELDRLPEFAFFGPEQQLGRAWALVAGGDLPAARRSLQAAAELARTSGHRGSEAWLLHDVARLGEPASVVDRLEELAAECEGSLVAGYAAHASAAAAGLPQALVDVTDRFEQLGAMLLAAEAATEAAQAFQREGDRRRAAALGVRAAALAGACEGARTPALTMPIAVAALTPRERDIATLAAQGERSQEIANRLFLSVRTVDNHLQSVYAKLGVSGRRELATALADVDVRGGASPR
jgi:ATP/maltotriose-dependent transcriptional regulator MalT